jgi:hypothetical protein
VEALLPFEAGIVDADGYSNLQLACAVGIPEIVELLANVPVELASLHLETKSPADYCVRDDCRAILLCAFDAPRREQQAAEIHQRGLTSSRAAFRLSVSSSGPSVPVIVPRAATMSELADFLVPKLTEAGGTLTGALPAGVVRLRDSDTLDSAKVPRLEDVVLHVRSLSGAEAFLYPPSATICSTLMSSVSSKMRSLKSSSRQVSDLTGSTAECAPPACAPLPRAAKPEKSQIWHAAPLLTAPVTKMTDCSGDGEKVPFWQAPAGPAADVGGGASPGVFDHAVDFYCAPKEPSKDVVLAPRVQRAPRQTTSRYSVYIEVPRYAGLCIAKRTGFFKSQMPRLVTCDAEHFRVLVPGESAESTPLAEIPTADIAAASCPATDSGEFTVAFLRAERITAKALGTGKPKGGTGNMTCDEWVAVVNEIAPFARLCRARARDTAYATNTAPAVVLPASDSAAAYLEIVTAPEVVDATDHLEDFGMAYADSADVNS